MVRYFAVAALVALVGVESTRAQPVDDVNRKDLQVFKDVAREQGVHFIPFFLEGVAGDPSLNQGDGIHPNPTGAQIVERNLWKAIQPLLEKQD